MSPLTQSQNVPIDWTEVLNKIQETIDIALGELSRREEAEGNLLTPNAEGHASATLPEGNSAWLGNRPDASSVILEQVRHSGREADDELKGTETELRQWLEANDAITRSLERWAQAEV